MVDKRIKIHEIEIYEFIKEKKRGRIWTELKNKFVPPITQQQLSNKLNNMVYKKNTLRHIGKYYLPNFFYTPKPNEIDSSYHEKIEDPYISQGFNRYHLEKIEDIIQSTLFIRWKELVEKYREMFEKFEEFENIQCNHDYLMHGDHDFCPDCRDIKKAKYNRIINEKPNYYDDMTEINALKYYFKEGYKYYKFNIKE